MVVVVPPLKLVATSTSCPATVSWGSRLTTATSEQKKMRTYFFFFKRLDTTRKTVWINAHQVCDVPSKRSLSLHFFSLQFFSKFGKSWNVRKNSVAHWKRCVLYFSQNEASPWFKVTVIVTVTVCHFQFVKHLKKYLFKVTI